MKLFSLKKIKLFFVILLFFYSYTVKAEIFTLKTIDNSGCFTFENGQKAFLRDVWLQSNAIDYLQKTLFEGDKLNLDFEKNKFDRYQRLSAYIYKDNNLVQKDLLEKGLAIFYASDNDANSTFINFEKDARNKQIGFWQSPDNIKNVSEINPFLNDKAIVTGTVHHIKKTKKKTYINFGENYKKSFSIEIDNFEIPELKNKKILARGFIRKYHSPFMQIFTPLHIEMIE